MVRNLDQLSEFDEFRREVLPKLARAVKEKKSVEEILAMCDTLAAARLGTIVATETDTGKALSAIKDLLDRKHGKSTERKEIKHKFENLSEDELDSVLVNKLKKLSDEDEKNEPIN
jgi:hypothetical protein